MAKYDPDVLASTIVTFCGAALALVLRLVARRITSIPLWYDDYVAVVAFLFACGWSAIVLYWAIDAGLGLRLEEIPHLSAQDALEKSLLLLYLAEIIYAFALAFAKLAILAFYWRMFKLSNIRKPILVLAGCSIIWLIIRTFLAIFHCVPIQAFWDKSIEDPTCSVNDSSFFFGTVLTHLLIDIAILALPVLQVKQLQLRIGQKIAVIAVFMFGILVCIASVVVLVESLKYDANGREMPLNISPIIVWATVEVNLAIISACLPMLRPVFRKLVPGSMLSSGGNSYPTKTPSRGIKLATLTRTKDVDESSSTHQLADLENGSADSGEYDRMGGPQTVISSRARGYTASRDTKATGQGIHVRNEMSVQIESAYSHPQRPESGMR